MRYSYIPNPLCRLTILATLLHLYKRAKREKVTGVQGPMITVVPTSLPSALLRLKPPPHYTQMTFCLKLSSVHRSIEELLSQYHKIDDIVTSQLCEFLYLIIMSSFCGSRFK